MHFFLGALRVNIRIIGLRETNLKSYHYMNPIFEIRNNRCFVKTELLQMIDLNMEEDSDRINCKRKI